jgi:hypothetical protein
MTLPLPFSRRQVFPDASGESLTFWGTFHNSLERSMNGPAAFRHNKMTPDLYCEAQ